MTRLHLCLLCAMTACGKSTPSAEDARVVADRALDTSAPQGDVGPRADAPARDTTTTPDRRVDGPPSVKELCFKNIGNLPGKPGPNYDQFKAVPGSHCSGTNHQDIKGIQKVVFLGDSVTAGTPPTAPNDYYRSRLTAMLEQKFGKLESATCAEWGARTDDLLEKPHEQIVKCFPKPEPKRTLVVMTVGGNDTHAFAKAASDGATLAQLDAKVDVALAHMRKAIEWFRADPARFPAGVFVIFGNIYEYTDGTGDLLSCPLAILAGLGSKPWPEGRAIYIKMNEQFMKIAVDTKTDMIFMLEHFCGHGFKAKDPTTECYRGPTTETWFDLTCIHPTPVGHEQIAKMFMNVVNE